MAIGSALRHFAIITCAAFATKELRRETAARQRRASKKDASQSSNAMPTTSERIFSALPKKFNVLTIKNHSLGDYPDQIRRYGTTDSYSTEPVCSYFLFLSPTFILNAFSCQCQSELEHRKPKSRYKRTDKKNFVKQLAQIERREARLRRINSKLPNSRRSRTSRWRKAARKPISPQVHHHIGRSEDVYEHVGTFLRQRSGDPAIQV